MTTPASLPVTPLFLCDDSREWIELEASVKLEQKASVLGLVRRPQFIGYDFGLIKWRRCYPVVAVSPWRRLLAYTVYNPELDVRAQWHRIGDYKIEELRSVFLAAVEHDDDVLTQFVERDELIERLKAASTFQDLVKVWEWLSTEPERTEHDQSG